MGTRRAPRSITLVLIGSAALSGCGDETARRDIYRTSRDCQADWGDVTQCTPASDSHSGYYYGPYYRDNRRNNAGTTTGPRPGSNAIGTAHVARNASSGSSSSSTSRGGFGSSASSHSSGG